MARYIDAERYSFPTLHQKEVNDYMKGWNACLKSVLQQPTADVEEVKHAKWEYECLECSVCKRNISEICDADSYISYGIEDDLKYCPFCGAKMDGGKAVLSDG